MKLLKEIEGLSFFVDKEFDIRYLCPVQRFVQWKLESNNWDDYNELYYASKFINALAKYNKVWLDSHLLFEHDKIIGALFIVGGRITQIEKNLNIKNEEKSLLLKYFHVVEKGKGYGSLWLNGVVIPYYKEKSFEHIYINSSHPSSFSFYSRLGNKISDYEQQSDNKLHKRLGSSFLIQTNYS